MKKIAILQSNYIPWKGYFDLINMVDEFILYDDVQFTKNDWRNRNLIKTQHGLKWLTIPIDTAGKLNQPIKEAKITDSHWAKKHWHSLVTNYAKTKGFERFKNTFEPLYTDLTEMSLSLINFLFIKTICGLINIKTKISWSMDYHFEGTKNESLVQICKQAGATHYLSGPKAKNYIDENEFEKAEIQVSWMDYLNYPEYSQLYPPFEHGVSILDLLFNTGEEAPKYMKSFNC